MNVPSKPINITKLNCCKNSKLEIIVAMNTDKMTILAAFAVVDMEIWKQRSCLTSCSFMSKIQYQFLC